MAFLRVASVGVRAVSVAEDFDSPALLQQFEEKSSNYVMSAETMKSYALDAKI